MAEDITVIDGGFSSVVEHIGLNLMDDRLWTAGLLYTHPSVIVEVHKRYLASGCNVITTASYQASVAGFQKKLGSTLDESIRLIKSSVSLAKQAKEEYLENIKETKDKKITIAGSIGPYGACLANGSEYSGNYCDVMTHEELIEWHRPRIQCLVEAGVDLLAMETIPAAKEGEVLMKLLQDFSGVKGWLSFSCQTAHETSHKEDIGLVAKNCMKIAPSPQLVAIGVNCCRPSYVSSLLMDISTNIPGFPLIAYPNSGESWISGKGWTNGKEKPISSYLDSWISTSAKFVGGCCRTGPEDITQIVEQLRARKF